MTRIGIITGSGSHALAGLQAPRAQSESTRFGDVALTCGTLAGREVVHVSRHGPGHERLSSHVNHRANLAALAQRGVQAILAVTVCGATDPALRLGQLLVFDDLHFPSNRLPDGSLCSLYDVPGAPERGHWVFEGPFSEPLRLALLEAAGPDARDGGCYGHVDGPRFNTRSEIAALARLGVSAVSQTAGPETVLAGEAQIPYALLGFVTDHANGVAEEPTTVEELTRLLRASADTFARVLAGAAQRLDAAPPPTGTVLRF